MKTLQLTAIIGSAAMLTICGASRADHKRTDNGDWALDFHIRKEYFVSSGANPYFILKPGYKLVLADAKVKLVITVLKDTKKVDGVVTRVVEERETENGKPVEVSRNYFAIDKRNNDLYYFGEDVDVYKAGKIVGHQGAWLSGVKLAKYGLMLPGRPAPKLKYYQENAPRVAMDRAEILSVTETVKTPAGIFKNCVKTLETTPLEPAAKAQKIYAPGVGIVSDGALKLVEYSKPYRKGRS